MIALRSKLENLTQLSERRLPLLFFYARSGEYRCVASNTLAARESRTVRLRYNGPNGRPQFIESPQNVVVSFGPFCDR